MAYKYLVPINYLLIEENLKNSLRQFGLLNPIVLSQGKIVDGIKRHYLCKRFKKKLYFQKLELNPYLLRLQLNLNREWTLPEIAYMYLNSSQELKKSLCFYLGIKEFPKLEEIFKLLISSKFSIKNSILGKLNISILNDLIIWEKDSRKILEKFLKVFTSKERGCKNSRRIYDYQSQHFKSFCQSSTQICWHRSEQKC